MSTSYSRYWMIGMLRHILIARNLRFIYYFIFFSSCVIENSRISLVFLITRTSAGHWMSSDEKVRHNNCQWDLGRCLVHRNKRVPKNDMQAAQKQAIPVIKLKFFESTQQESDVFFFLIFHQNVRLRFIFRCRPATCNQFRPTVFKF